MRLKLLFFFLLFLPFPGISQKLSLNKLLKFQGLSEEEIGRQLIRKHWQLVSADKPTPDLLGKTVWAYAPDPESGTAVAWCILYHSETTPNRILYNPSDGNTLADLRKKITKRNGIKPLEATPRILPAYLTALNAFTDGKYVFLLQTYVQPGYGGLKIFRQEDYLKALGNGKL